MKVETKRLLFLSLYLILLLYVGGCIRPIQVFPQSTTINGVTINVEIIRDFKWYSLSQDIMVLNLEVINNSNEGIWIYPLGKSVIISANGRQYMPIREFKSNEPPSFSLLLSSNDEEKKINELIKTYELLKFKDGKVFPGARVSGILAFYTPYVKYPLRFIIPEVFWENSLQKYDFEFIIGR